MFITKISNKKKLRKFKKRSKPLTINNWLFSNYGLVFIGGGFLKLNFFKRIIKIFRKKTRKRGKRVWLFFLINYSRSRKSRMSRMGKGKGKFKKYALFLKNYKIFCKFSGYSYFRVVKFINYLKYEFNYKILVTRW